MNSNIEIAKTVDEAVVRSERRYRLIHVSPEMVFELICAYRRNEFHKITVVENKLPDDTFLVNLSFDSTRQAWCMCIGSAEFEKNEDVGSTPRIINPTYQVEYLKQSKPLEGVAYPFQTTEAHETMCEARDAKGENHFVVKTPGRIGCNYPWGASDLAQRLVDRLNQEANDANS